MKRVPGSRAAPSPARPAWRPLLTHQPAESCGVGSAGILLRARLRAGPTAGLPASVRPACPRGAPPTSGPAPLASARSPRSGLGGRGLRRPGRRARGSFRAPHPSLAARSGAGPAGRPCAPSAVPRAVSVPRSAGAGPQAPPPRAAAAGPAGGGAAFLSGGAAGRRGRLLPQAGRRGGLALRPRGRSGGAALPQAGGGRTALPASQPRVGAA